MTSPASLSIRHNRDRALFAAVTVARQDAGMGLCRACDTPLVLDVIDTALGAYCPTCHDYRGRKDMDSLPSAVQQALAAWETASAALGRVLRRLDDLTANGRRPTATELAALLTDARVAWYAELAAEAAYVKAANALHGWTA